MVKRDSRVVLEAAVKDSGGCAKCPYTAECKAGNDLGFPILCEAVTADDMLVAELRGRDQVLRERWEEIREREEQRI